MILPILLGVLYAGQGHAANAPETRNSITKATTEIGTCYRDERRAPFFTRYCDFKENGPGLDGVEFGTLPHYVTRQIIIVDKDKMPVPGTDVVSDEKGRKFVMRRDSKSEKALSDIYRSVAADFEKPENK